MEKYDFEINDLSCYDIEDKVTSFYQIGYAHSSSLNELQIGGNYNLFISAVKANIEFDAMVGKTKNDTFSVSITPKSIKYKK